MLKIGTRIIKTVFSQPSRACRRYAWLNLSAISQAVCGRHDMKAGTLAPGKTLLRNPQRSPNTTTENDGSDRTPSCHHAYDR